MHGIGFDLPFGRECFMELRREWVGFGLSGDSRDREIFLGRVQIILSKTRGIPAKRSRKRLMALVFLTGLLTPVSYGAASDKFSALIGWGQGQQMMASEPSSAAPR